MRKLQQRSKKIKQALLCLAVLFALVSYGKSASMPGPMATHKKTVPAKEDAAAAMAGIPGNAGTNTGLQKTADGKPQSLSIAMVGDILFHTAVAESGIQDDGSYSYDAIFAQIAPVIQKADLALVNQEVIIGGKELGISGYPCFNAPYELGDALAKAGFNVILHATNHALDKGKTGIQNCIRFWESSYPDIAVLGIHGSKKQQKELYVHEQNGIRVAILNYTYGTNGIPLPQGMPYAVDLLNKKKVKKDLAKARRLADFIIVCPHWGTEFLAGKSKEQEGWAQFFLENGAGLVIGTHPHVVEPVEWLHGKNGKSMLAYYSLGNFVNWTTSTGNGVSDRMVGGMAQVTLQKNKDGKVSISEYHLEPLVCHLEKGSNGVTVYFLKDYTKKLASKNEIRKQDGSFSLQYCKKLWKSMVRQ